MPAAAVFCCLSDKMRVQATRYRGSGNVRLVSSVASVRRRYRPRLVNNLLKLTRLGRGWPAFFCLLDLQLLISGRPYQLNLLQFTSLRA